MSVVGYIPAQPVVCAPSMWEVLRRKLGNARGFWALADQVLISGTNFVTMVLVARGLSKSAFGEFSLVYSGLLFANLLQTGLVTQPHNVLGAMRFARTKQDYFRYTATTGLSQLLLAGVEVIAALGLAGIALAAHWNSALLLLSLAPAIAAWQLQEFVRRVLYSEGRTAAALLNDVISYGLQTVLIALLWRFDRLTAPAAIYVLGATSGAAALVGLFQIHSSLGGRIDLSVFRENWQFGKWLLGSEVLSWCASLSAYMYIACAMLGTAAGGELRAVQILFGPARVFSFFLCTILPIQFAQAITGGGDAALRRQLLKVSRYVIVLMALYCAAVALFARPLLTITYGRQYAGSATILVMYSAVSYISYIQMLFVAALTAQRRTRQVFLASLCGALITAVVSWALIHALQLPGALVGMIVTQVAVASVLVCSYFQAGPSLRERRKQSLNDKDPRVVRDGFDQEVPPGDSQLREESQAGSILLRVLEVMERAGVRWCLLHGYERYPQQIDSDVDLLVGSEWLPDGLVQLLISQSDRIGAQVVQWFDDGAQLIVIAAARDDGSTCLLQLHVTDRYTLCGHVFASGEKILSSRRRVSGMWVPAPHLEFICVLTNRICKRSLTAKHADRLVQLYRQDGGQCDAQLARFFDGADQRLLVKASQEDSWSSIHESIEKLRGQLLDRAPSAGDQMAAFLRRMRRWLRPRCGLHLVFLGPDGVGKSTVIHAFQSHLHDAFLHNKYLTFAPSLLPARLAQPKPGGPHSLPPRSWPLSLIKAAWWLACYTLGYYASVYPTLARAGMVVNHRYLLDAMIDRRRYRYSGPRWLLKLIWKIVPKPDLVLLLDAPPEVIRARKSELPLERIVELREGYLAAVTRLPNGHIIDASKPLSDVVARVEAIVVEYLSARVQERALGETAPIEPAEKPAPPQDTTESSAAVMPPPALTWTHLLPANASLTYSAHNVARAASPCSPEGRYGLVAHATNAQHVRVSFQKVAPGISDDEAGLVAINCRRASVRRFEQEGLKCVRRFAALPTLRQARWFVPLDSGAVASAGLSLYTPARTSARLKRAAVRIAMHLRIPWWYRDEVVVALRQPPPLEQKLASIFGNDFRLALSAGAPEGARNRKASALAMDPSGRLLGFIKLARSPIARAIVAHEASVLPQLQHIQAPRLMFYGDVDGTDVLVQTPLPGRPAPLAFGPMHQGFLVSLQTKEHAPATETRMVAMLPERLSGLPGGAERLQSILDDLTPTLAAITIPVTIVHGDFAPWNLRLHNRQISAFDWEYAQLSGLPLVDEIHYRLQVGLLIDGWSPERAANELTRIANDSLLDLKPDQVRAIICIYLLDALARLLAEDYGEDHEMIVWHQNLLERIAPRISRAVVTMAVP